MSGTIYPKELRSLLHETFTNEGLTAAVEKVHAAFPEYKDRLTRARAQSVIRVISQPGKHRGLHNVSLKQSPRNIAPPRAEGQLAWSEIPDDLRNKIVRKAARLHARGVRWSVISRNLADKYPEIQMLKAHHLARVVVPKQKKLGSLPEQSSSSSKSFMLHLSNGGSFELKKEINPKMAHTIIGIVMEIM